MPRPLRVAVLGFGHMGRLHAAKLEALCEAGPGAVTVVPVDPARGFGGSVEGIDAAIVATPTATHAEVALPLLARGVPCLVEKPLAATLEQARALAAWPGLAVGHIERFNPALAALGGAGDASGGVASGGVADLRFVQAERVGRWTPRGTDVDVILDLMIHDLDLFLHYAGGDEVVDVRANGVAVATNGFDLAHARVETASGRVATFTASRLARAPARRWRAFGGEGYLHLDLGARAAVRVSWGPDGVVETPLEVPTRDALQDEVAAFLAAVRGEGPFRPSGADGLRALVLAERIRAAAQASGPAAVA